MTSVLILSRKQLGEVFHNPVIVRGFENLFDVVAQLAGDAVAGTTKTLIPRKQLENVETAQYTATNCRAVFDAFTLTNTSGGAATVTIHLVPSGGAASAANCVLSAKSIAAGATYVAVELVGQSLEPGDFISTLASAATAITVSATGREIT